MKHMDLYNARYLVLDGKTPTHKFSDFRLYENVLNEKDLGVLVDKPYVVLDFDDGEHADTALRLIKRHGFKCNIMKTTRGIHVWFKAPKDMRNNTNIHLACGLICDIRSSNNGQVVVKKNGEWREWIDIETTPQTLPKLFWPIYRAEKGSNGLLKLGEGDGRNQILFEYIIKLVNNGFTRDEVVELYKEINKFMFASPLSENELNTILREDAFKDVEKTVKKMTHDLMAETLINEMTIIKNNGRLFYYDGKRYVNDDNVLFKEIIARNKSSKETYRQEVKKYINILLDETEPVLNNDFILVNNGIVKVATNTITEFTERMFFRNKINADFDPNAFDEYVENVLQKITCGDEDVRNLVEEMIGYCLTQNTIYQKFFVIVGTGSNGKSTFFRMLRNFLGKENLSSLSIEDFESQFRPAGLLDKIANIGDDIDGAHIKKTDMLKSATTGDALIIEKKGVDAFTYEPYAKLIFSCNTIPLFADKSNGMKRRMVIIPFDAQFSPNDDDYNPNINDLVLTDNARSYLLNIALRGLKRLMENGQFTESTKVLARTMEYERDNNNIMLFFDDEAESIDFENEGLKELYNRYLTWCAMNDMYKPFGRMQFKETIKSHLGREYKQVSQFNKKVWRFVERKKD